MMNLIKKFTGVIWILAGPLAIYYLVKTAASEISKKPVIDTKIQWGVFIGVFFAHRHWPYDFRVLRAER